MFKNDNIFNEELQKEQKEQCRVIMESNEAICDEQVLIIRQAINATDSDKELLKELSNEFRKATDKFKQKATINKRKFSSNFDFPPITGKCTKHYDKRKGNY